jgi:uncharacterized repeat protein (TIGR01451 family)
VTVSRFFSGLGLALLCAAGLALSPSAVSAQKALVYCPVSVDGSGCGPIATALAADFPDGVDNGFDGGAGTVDLASADLSGYAVLVIPSLAEGAGADPYAELRDQQVASRINSAFGGRTAVWSGTPDHGTTNRTAKDALLRNLAGWAKGGGTAGIVVLQDNSDDAGSRYGWLTSISGLSITADTTFDVYSNVQTVTATGRTILTSGGLQIGYTNMASYGLIAPAGASSDATGGRSSRVVLVTRGGEASAALSTGIATVVTDKEDYNPGDQVTVSGTGWDPGETVSLLFHEDVDPAIHPDRTLTALADESGKILNQEYLIDEQDVGIRFILTATGLTSGKTAQTTFTDGNKTAFSTTAAGAEVNVFADVPVNQCVNAFVQSLQGGNIDNGQSGSVTLSSAPAGVAFFGAANCTGSAITSVTFTNQGSRPISFRAATANSYTLTGDGSWSNASNDASATINVKQNQTITFTSTAPTAAVVGGPNYTATATASSGLAVSFSSLTPTVCTSSGTNGTIISHIAVGTCTVAANQAGNAFTNPAPQVIQSYSVGKGSQTIAFTSTAPTAAVVGGTAYTATAGGGASGNPVTFSSLTTAVCTSGGTNGATINFIAAGPCNIAANQLGNTNYNDAPQVTQSFTVGKGSQTITFTSTPPSPATVGAVYTVTATGGASGNAVTFSSTTTSVCTSTGTNGATITFIAAGTCTVAANQAGNANYNAATQATQTFTVIGGIDVTINKSHTGTFTVGSPASYTLVVTNGGGAPTTNAPLTVTDVLPAGLSFVSTQVQGNSNWTCGFVSATQTVTCTRTTPIAAGAVAPTITLNVTPTAAAVPTVTNTASVSGGGEPAANNGNNSDSDPTNVVADVDLTIDKSHTGNFTEGVNGTYSLTVSNAGGTVTSTVDVTVTDVLPAGLGFVSGTGTGWTNCTFATTTRTVTCVRPRANAIAPRTAAPAITLTVSVAAAAVPTVTNTASVAGGNEPTANNGNNSDSDPTTVIAANSPPVVDAGGPYSGNEGSAIALNTATATDPDAGDTPTYKWTYVANGPVDVGTTCSFSNDAIVQPTFTCNDDGAFTATLTVDDGHSHIVHDDAAVTVNNAKPVANAGGPYSGDEGTAIALNGSATDPGTNDAIVSYKWTVDVTGIDAGGKCTFDDDTKRDAKVTCTDNSNATPFTLTLTATDDDGAASTGAAVALTVNNANPVADAGGPYSGDEGSAISLNGTVTDAGTNDTHTWSWKYVPGPDLDANASCSFSSATAVDPTITCTDNGTVELTFTATDDNGGSGSDKATLTVKNVAPVAHAGGPYSGKEGEAIALDGSATDAGANDGLTYKWTVDVTGIDAGGACTFDSDTKKDAKVTCTDNSNTDPFTLKLVATDDDGGISAISQTTLTVANADPVADAGGGTNGYSGDEGSAIPLNGSATDPGSNDKFSWSWEYVGVTIDAGAKCTFSSTTVEDPTVTCTDNGEVKLTLTVTDDNGGHSSDDAKLTVKNVAPVAKVGGPYSGKEGEAIALDGSATDAGTNDIISYKWTVDVTGIDAGGKCTFDNDTKPDAKVTCTDNSNADPFTLKLVATDDDGLSSPISETTLTVENSNPVAEAGGTGPGPIGTYSGDEGSAIQLYGSATDAGSNDTFTWSWEYTAGEGFINHATCSFDDATAKQPKITCNDNGTVKLTLTVKDDNGGTGTDDATLNVANVDPVANAGGGASKTYTGDEGSAIQLYGSATDAGSNDTFIWAWEYTAGDGFINGATCKFDNATAQQPKITCNDNGTVSLKLTVADDDGGKDDDAATLTVKNVNPVAKAGGPYAGDEGSGIHLAGSATDAGTNDDITYKWTADVTGITSSGHCTFDDATKADAIVTCDDNGTAKLTLTATDDDNGVGTSTVDVPIANVDPVAEAGGTGAGPIGTYTGDEGSAIQLYGSATDAGSNDTFTWGWEYTAGEGFINHASCSFNDATAKQPKITCNDNGTVKLTLTVTDDDGGKGLDYANLNVVNVDPVVDAGGPYTGDEGATISLNGKTTDAGTNDTHTWQWKYVAGDGFVDGATCSFTNPTSETPTISCTDNGTVQLTFTAKDDDGGEGSDGATLTLKNVAPVAKAGGPYSGTEGQAIQLAGSATDAGANDALSYQWTVNAAGIDPNGACTIINPTQANATVTCTDDSGLGHFSLSLVATDDDGGVSVASTANLTVTNANPIVSTGGPYSGNEGAAIQLYGSATDPGTNDAITYKWTAATTGIDAGGACSFDDDTKKNAKATCTDDSGTGTFTLTLTASDDDGGSASQYTTLKVQNVAPTIAGLSKPDGTALPATIIVAGTMPIKVPFSDPATNDTHTAQIDCGTGYVNIAGNVTTGFQTSCTFATIGPKTIKVKVTDDDGGVSNEMTQSITVKYLFDGFYAPVDRPNVMNLSKAGQAIPLKWRLTNALGAPITDLTGVTVQAVGMSCGVATTTDQIEEYAAGASGLQNLGNGNYQFNWKTPSTYANSCKSIALVFGAGGTSYTENPSAFFTFKP